MEPTFNKSSPEHIEYIKSLTAVEKREQPREYELLKRAQDKFEEQQLKREQDSEFDIGEDDE